MTLINTRLIRATLNAFWLAGVGSVVLFGSAASAARFQNQFVEFELPPKWQCNLEGAEWVCQNTDKDRKRDAIIVLAAKLKGDQDGLVQYDAYLKQPKTWTTIKGKNIKSEVRSVKQGNVGGQSWVDALHLESEIAGFYTRYLGTVKEDIAVLVTYSVNKDKWTEYQGDFDTMVQTLRVFRKAGGLNSMPQNQSIFARTPIQQQLTDTTVFGTGGEEADQKPVAKKEDDSTLYIALGIGAILFILWRRRRSNG